MMIFPTPFSKVSLVILTPVPARPSQPIARWDPSKMELEPEETELGVLTREDFGSAWPLTVPFVLVASRPVELPGGSLTAATLITPDGVRYAVNGTAKAHTQFRSLEPGDSVWADHPDIAGVKKDISAIIDACRNLGAE